MVAAFINRVAPVLIKAYATLFEFFQLLPQDLMMVVFGVALCFFGGVYPAAIAAAEVRAQRELFAGLHLRVGGDAMGMVSPCGGGRRSECTAGTTLGST